MDKVKGQGKLIGKKMPPFVSSPPPNITNGELGDFKIPVRDANSPENSPPSPPPPPDASRKLSPPPPAASPPPKPPPTPAPPPPSPPPLSPPPSSKDPPSSKKPPSSKNPPPSPPQPPPQTTPSESPPVTVPSPKLSPPPPPPPSPLFLPPTITQPDIRPSDDPQPTPISPPLPPSLNSPFLPPSPIDSDGGGSPPIPFPSNPVIPQTPIPPIRPFQPPNPLPSNEQNSQPSSSLSPSPYPISGSKNHSGSSDPSNVNHTNGSKGHVTGSNYDNRTLIGIGIAGAVVIMFIAAIFLIKKRNSRRVARRRNQQYLPSANIAVKPSKDGYNYYGMKGGNGNNSGQNSSGEIQKPERTDSTVIGTTKTIFTYEELNQITEGFSKKNIVGEGGFGYVYKGVFADGQNVAIKQLKSSNAESYREFKAEVEIISRVHHRHLVSLVGYCISEQHRFLIYEFVPNNTLDYHLHGIDLPVLDWSKRVKIAIGAAKGLAYLHEDCHPKIIHRDIKSSNILLDDEFEAQVADFGLARLNDTTQSHISTRVMGTFGYLAPEYALSGKLTDRSDVFSFGVVLLELITGRKSVDPSQPLDEESLVEWARPRLIEAIETGDVSNLVDHRLENDYAEREVYKMIETAASCVRHSAPKRPRMVQVVRALDSKQELSDLTNGIKVGQSMVYNSAQYSQEIRNFRKKSFVSGDFSDFGTSGDYTSHELEIRALNTRRT